jgi:hypothetical protein
MRPSKRDDFSLGNILFEAATQGFGDHPPTAQQGNQRLGGDRIKTVYNDQGLRQMLVEALAKYRVVEHQILAGTPLDIDRTLTQFLDRSRQLDGLLAVAATLFNESLDDQPALHSNTAKQQDDQHEAEQHALAKGNPVHPCGDCKSPSLNPNEYWPSVGTRAGGSETAHKV